MPSFDVVCEIDAHEVGNAVDQASRELQTRFDFKGVEANFELAEGKIVMGAENDFQLKQMLDILHKKLTKRQIDLKHLDEQEPLLQGTKAEQTLLLQEGIDAESAKKIVKAIKTEKLKVQAAIQGDKVRVSGKKRDDLQQVIAFLRDNDYGRPLQYINFRD